MAQSMQGIRKLNTTHWIAIASIFAIAFGIFIGPLINSIFGQALGPVIIKEANSYIKLIGDIFLRLITAIVPLMIMGVVVQAVGQLELKTVGKIGFKIFVWFLVLTVIAAFIGIWIGFLVQPGVGLPKQQVTSNIKPTTQSLQDTFLNLFSSNIINSLATGSTIQIIIFALFLGAAISKYTENSGDRSIIEAVTKFNGLIVMILKSVMKYVAPFGCFALLAVATSSLGVSVFQLFLKYLGGLLVACAIFMVINIMITAFWCKVSPVKLTTKLAKMTLVAMTTTSSAVTLPTEMEDAVTKFGISPRIVNLASPLGMVFNSTGQAIFMAIASIMFSQFYGLDLPMTRIVQIVAISVLACLGNAAVPGGGLVVLVSMMPILGLPLEAIGLIAGVDWFRGAISTVPNVDSDVLVALCIAKDEGELDYDVFNGKKVVAATAIKGIG